MIRLRLARWQRNSVRWRRGDVRRLGERIGAAGRQSSGIVVGVWRGAWYAADVVCECGCDDGIGLCRGGCAGGAGAKGKQIDLVPLIDAERDGVAGTWAKDGEKVTCNTGKGKDALLELPWVIGGDFDLRVTFRVMSGDRTINVIGVTPKGPFAWGYGIAEKYAGVRNVDGKDVNDPGNPTYSRDAFLKYRQRYTAVVKVRGTSIEGYLQNAAGCAVDAGKNRVVLPKVFALRHKEVAGINFKNGEAVVDGVELTVYSGKGKGLYGK